MRTPYLKQCWENMRYHTLPQDARYDDSSDDDHFEKDRLYTPVWKNPTYGLRQARQRRLAYCGAILLLLIFFGTLLFNHPMTSTSPSFPEPSTGHLRLLAPTTSDLLRPTATMNRMLCKSLLSSMAVGYPASTLINYNVSIEKNFFTMMTIGGGSHMLKIKGVRSYLNNLDSEYDDDVVVVYDATDTWFQLPPQLLLSRYLELRRDANARLSKRYGRAARQGGMTEQVFFSVQKACGLNKSQQNATGCHAAPESSLPTDVFGPNTDGPAPSGQRSHVMRRPRWVNSGFVIGTVGAMRPVYNMAYWLQYQPIGRVNGGSDQFLMTELVGMQNAWRHLQAEKYRSWTDKVSLWVSSFFSGGPVTNEPIDPADYWSANPNINWASMYNLTEKNFELGLGLDEQSRLSQVAWSFEKELEWTTHDNHAGLTKLYHDRGLQNFSQKATTLPSDLLTQPPPFASISPSAQSDLTTVAEGPSNETWAGVPLVTNLYTGEVPVSFHMCGIDWKSRIATHWSKPWFHSRVRSLLDAAVAGPTDGGGGSSSSTALGVTEVGGKKREWFGRGTSSSSARGAGMLGTDRAPGDVAFAEVCGSHWEELMGDGGGKWVNPVGKVEEGEEGEEGDGFDF